MPTTGEPIVWMMAPANLLHGALAWTLLVMIFGHVGMVVLHRWWWQDDVLPRMAGRKSRHTNAEGPLTACS